MGVTLKVLAFYSFIAFLPPLFLTESRAGWLWTLASLSNSFVVCLAKKQKTFCNAIANFFVGKFTKVAGYQYSETFQRRMEPVVTFLEGQAEEGLVVNLVIFDPTWMDTLEMIV